MTDTLPLNDGQAKAASAFLRFLLTPDEKEFIISGPAGTGKTFLMRHLTDTTMQLYRDACLLGNLDQMYKSIQMTATTNKAAEVLSQAIQQPASTVHSFLKLRVQNDYSTGKSILKRAKTHKIITNTIIFIDECSFIDTDLYNEIQSSTLNCKIVYVGDDKQLAPVFEEISKVYSRELPVYYLTEQMRNNGQQHLMDLSEQMRETVRTGEFNPIKIIPGVIDHIASEDDLEQLILDKMLDADHDGKILAYTNNQVMMYNSYLRYNRGLGDRYVVGDNLVSNSAMETNGGRLSIEQELTVTFVSDTNRTVSIDDSAMDVYDVHVEDKLGETHRLAVPVDYEFYFKLKNYFKSQRAWQFYYQMEEQYPDLRPKDAATVHKSQGSTYDFTIIDLNDISNVRKPNEAARMLYVAVTRAKSHIYLFGSLSDKYGGLIL